MGIVSLASGMGSRAMAEEMLEMKPIVVTIGEKSEETNQVFVGESRFRVPPGTPIQDHRGRSLTLRELPIPCRAEITYKISSSRERVAEKIQMK
jgi:hypothetical protein